ncbi:NADP oxidoreductase [bacterium (Candidatus Blackallbacteria) CG17_big_fil_post_rev_8_21_14_2_50_48_46]|uniref:NADP oxidoreductase n=1 Tax=bacterium (Candidatus Blackallbacteria) CG17_big_fil_post_rev_8_21_14_2_50_48_46 TaxID=2014261 RepID=A0A2M7G3M2_9BACT|nr:MAG: NADP oxidoreductase [bacterium (Candidatus Blackallbacteria) CG18_big_fil_WC_8_21_14_2_50_49_26]PIW16321.1 MAG: NADP oxidoreductase [bacterium (Candidatus Blackallbacteria) CG17_big_fil_post_rev_8_21_14_2_50_48_46]PIW45335.1 MAG: NADP oxidoreductase [bacterium (Candidatus Blackallbacteria) CG13_big_fil_rev_8_21_14_2_50_49_14]
MSLGTPERPLRVAIIGAGPSGFYAAEALFKSDKTLTVDMYEKLPVPFGLVRSGVAPDHQKIKNVTKVYEKIASNPAFQFFGNVTIGKDITVEELKTFYDALIFTSGASSDRRLGIPGEDLAGSHTATEFVAWYNGHPEYRDRVFDLSQETAVIIGQGNVAIDVCRILSKSVDELKKTDIAKHALEALAESKIKDIYMIGRRGPAQAAFTPQEAKELGELEICDSLVNPRDMQLGPVCEAELQLADKAHNRKNMEILRALAEKGETGKARRLHVEFFYSPVELRGEGRLQEVVLERNALSGEAGKQKASGTGEKRVLPCGLLFRSVGYKGQAMPGVPFHESWGVFPNEKGKIENGLYVAGWIKRGPSGVIGTNKPCSYETVESLLADLDALPACATPHTAAVLELLHKRQVRVVSFEDWRKIDAAEIAKGQEVGKPREKFTSVADMLSVLNSAEVAVGV